MRPHLKRPRVKWRCKQCRQWVRKSERSLTPHRGCFLYRTMLWIQSAEYQTAMREGRDPGKEPMPVEPVRVMP